MRSIEIGGGLGRKNRNWSLGEGCQSKGGDRIIIYESTVPKILTTRD